MCWSSRWARCGIPTPRQRRGSHGRDQVPLPESIRTRSPSLFPYRSGGRRWVARMVCRRPTCASAWSWDRPTARCAFCWLIPTWERLLSRIRRWRTRDCVRVALRSRRWVAAAHRAVPRGLAVRADVGTNVRFTGVRGVADRVEPRASGLGRNVFAGGACQGHAPSSIDGGRHHVHVHDRRQTCRARSSLRQCCRFRAVGPVVLYRSLRLAGDAGAAQSERQGEHQAAWAAGATACAGGSPALSRSEL
jgi:hypothetical protein